MYTTAGYNELEWERAELQSIVAMFERMQARAGGLHPQLAARKRESHAALAFVESRLATGGASRSSADHARPVVVADPPAKSHRPTLSYKTAIHESGHCVAALAFGWTPDRVSVSEDGSGRCEINPARLDALTAAEQVAIAIAGRYAVLHAGYLAELNYVDAAHLRRGVGKVQGTIPRQEAERQGELLAEHVINDHWPKIEKLADVLVRRGTMGGQEIRRITNQ